MIVILTEETRENFTDIMESLVDIEISTSGFDFYSFLMGRETVEAVLEYIKVIENAVKAIPEDVRMIYPSIPWKKLENMRKRFSNSGSGIDVEKLWEVVVKELLPLKPLFEGILEV